MNLVRPVELAGYFARSVSMHPQLELRTRELSIATFRYVPAGVEVSSSQAARYLDDLNSALLEDLQRSGEAFLSNAIVDGDYLLRACIVNFRTTESDIDAVLETVCRIGKSLDKRKRPQYLAA